MSIVEGPIVAVAWGEYVDNVADAMVSLIPRELSDIHLGVYTTFNHYRFNSIDSLDSIYPRTFNFGSGGSSVLQVTGSANVTGFPALRLGGLGPTQTIVFE